MTNNNICIGVYGTKQGRPMSEEELKKKDDEFMLWATTPWYKRPFVKTPPNCAQSMGVIEQFLYKIIKKHD